MFYLSAKFNANVGSKYLDYFSQSNWSSSLALYFGLT